MEITLEMVDAVRERTGVTYEAAKAALESANGNVVDAIITIEKSQNEGGCSQMMEKLKAAIQKGNVTKIRVSKGEKELLTIPVTTGVTVGVLGLVAAPWAVIGTAVAGAVGKYGFDCKFELIKEDGAIDVL